MTIAFEDYLVTPARPSDLIAGTSRLKRATVFGALTRFRLIVLARRS